MVYPIFTPVASSYCKNSLIFIIEIFIGIRPLPFRLISFRSYDFTKNIAFESFSRNHSQIISGGIVVFILKSGRIDKMRTLQSQS